LPLGGDPKSDAFWAPVLEKIGKRLDGWKRSLMYKGGRLVLIHLVLESLPIYYLSLFKIPVRVASRIEKLMRDFLWEGVGRAKRIIW